ncbi:hypothetical protein BDW75DRAFT_240447 [Aspergillus navahoensis]
MGLFRTALTKHAHTFFFEHSDPGTVYSYEDWKTEKTAKAIVGPVHPDHVCRTEYETALFIHSNPWLKPYRWMYKPKEENDDHQFYTVALQDEFRDKGLQVIVKLRIANAIYAVDSENMSEEPQIAFRQKITRWGRKYVYDRIGTGKNPDGDESDFEPGHWDYYSDPENREPNF